MRSILLFPLVAKCLETIDVIHLVPKPLDAFIISLTRPEGPATFPICNPLIAAATSSSGMSQQGPITSGQFTSSSQSLLFIFVHSTTHCGCIYFIYLNNLYKILPSYCFQTSMLFDIALSGEGDGEVTYHYPVLSPLPIKPHSLKSAGKSPLLSYLILCFRGYIKGLV